MSRFIVDTNVVSEGWKDAPDENVAKWMNRHDYFVPVPVIAELVDGIERETNAANQLQLRTQLDVFLSQTLVLEWDVETAFIWGQLRNAPKTKLKADALWDSLIDAMAVRHNATVVTRNVSDFRHATVFDPWSDLEHLPGKASA